MKKSLKNFEECKECLKRAVNEIFEVYIQDERIVFPNSQLKVKISKVKGGGAKI